jgi:hypothetical protein
VRTAVAKKTKANGAESPSEKLQEYVQSALKVAKTAKRNRASLKGDNHYGNKLATLRSDAANILTVLQSNTTGNTSALAELIQAVFGADVLPKQRLEASRELSHMLKTSWRQTSVDSDFSASVDLFPMTILSSSNRGYLSSLGRQMNGCYTKAWYDACAVMMRRLMENAIIEAFEAKNVADQIKNKDGNYVQLTELVGKALASKSFNLSRNAKTALPKIKDLGHQSAHGRYFTAQKNDVDKVSADFRVVLEEFLHHANLIA